VPRTGFLILRLDPITRRVTRLAKDLTAEGEDLHASALSPDGKRLAVGCEFAGSLFVFDTATGRSIVKYGSAHASPISAIAFSGDGTKLATADVEGAIKIWADAQNLTSKTTALRTLKAAYTSNANTPGVVGTRARSQVSAFRATASGLSVAASTKRSESGTWKMPGRQFGRWNIPAVIAGWHVFQPMGS
jgi:WD40 repeat protein